MTRRQQAARFIEQVVYILSAFSVAWLIFLLATGCAVFSSQQVETTVEGNKRETRIRVYTMFDAQSDLTKLRASTTEKTQGVSLAGLSESATSTNAVHILQLIAQIVAAAK